MENYYRAKADLFTPERARHRVICVDDEWGQRLAREAMIPLDTLSSTGRAAQWQILAEPGELVQTIGAWQTRTQAFMAKNPGREGWSDVQGHTWNASQVLALLSDLLQRLESLQKADEFEEEGE